MVLTKAINLALECIDKEIRKTNFDANLFDKGLADYPMAQKASKHRQELRQAKVILEKIRGERS